MKPGAPGKNQCQGGMLSHYTYKELTLYLDAEDTRQNSKIEGYVGDTFVDNNGNVRHTLEK